MKTLVLLSLLAGSDLSMKDLQALADDGAWSEVLEKATTVTPAERTPAWKELVARAAAKSLEAPATGRPFAASERAQALAARFSFLGAHPVWLAARDATLVRDLRACLAAGDDDACWKQEAAWEKQLSGASALDAAHAFVESGAFAWRPMALFAAAVAKEPSACTDTKLPEALLAALSTPAGGAVATSAVQVLETCWSAVGAKVKAGWRDDTSFLTNACPTLLKKKVLSELQRDLCADAQR